MPERVVPYQIDPRFRGEHPQPFRLVLLQGDLIKQDVDAIVNPANETLLGGGGVDELIHRNAGPGLLAECRTLSGCATGDAKITGGYRLKARYVIHTVGPVYKDGKRGEAELLASCYRRILEIAREHKLKSIAIPAISTGAFGYPTEEAAQIVYDTIHQDLQQNGPGTLEEIRLVLWDMGKYQIYDQAFSSPTPIP